MKTVCFFGYEALITNFGSIESFSFVLDPSAHRLKSVLHFKHSYFLFVILRHMSSHIYTVTVTVCVCVSLTLRVSL